MTEKYIERVDVLRRTLATTFTEKTLTQLGVVAKIIAAAKPHPWNHSSIILTAGNGGSHAMAEHLAGELAIRLDKEHWLEIPTVCLTSNSAALTAAANDFGYDLSLGMLAESMLSGTHGSVVISFSTSGNSANIAGLHGMAATHGAKTVLFGPPSYQQGTMRIVSDFNFPVYHNLLDSVQAVDIIQEIHMTYLHILCKMVSEHLKK
jgi:phosphoheptose isomerase